jgi:hypothetical protein
MKDPKKQNEQVEFGHRRLSASHGIGFGHKPEMSLDDRSCSFWALLNQACVLAAIAGFVGFWISHIFQKDYNPNFRAAQYVAAVFFLLRIFWPYLQVLWGALRRQQKPSFHGWKNFTLAEKSAANAGLAFLLVLALNDVYGFAVNQGYMNPLPLVSHVTVTTLRKPESEYDKRHSRRYREYAYARDKVFIEKTSLNNATGLILLIALWLLLIIATANLEQKSGSFEPHGKKNPKFKNKESLSQKQQALIDKLPFGLWLGESTGLLSKLSHGVGMSPRQQVALFQDDAAQNILILGAIGTGKTTRAVHPLLSSYSFLSRIAAG